MLPLLLLPLAAAAQQQQLTGDTSRQPVVASLPSSLRSGDFVPLAGQQRIGTLACPQSLTTLQGIGFCVGVAPLGAAPVGPSATGADLFLQCSGQHLGAREGSFMLRYPFLRRDRKSGVPIFGNPISLSQDRVLPANVSLAALHAKVVWPGPNGTVLAAAFSSDLMHLLQLHENGTRWIRIQSYHYRAPPAWSPPASSDRYSIVHGVSSVAVSPASGGRWVVHSGVDGGESSRSNPGSTRISNKRSADYQPFGGDGVYRGRIGLVGVGQFVFNGSGSAQNYSLATPSAWTGGLMGLHVSTLKHNKERRVIGGSRTGIIYVISPNASAKPVPLIDNETGLLFVSRVIGAAPIPYPKYSSTSGGNGSEEDEDIIIGGENSVEYVAIDRIGGVARAHHVGPVLQEGASLVTGQTPTVSVCDWNHDGILDIIAGSSEGRVYFAQGTRNDGFLNPTTLHTTTGQGPDAAQHEIFVQGGYRVDLQGPSESRWGYTAPTCVDWNDDGLMDLVSSDNSALTKLYLRYRVPVVTGASGDGNGSLALRPAVALMVDGLVLHG
jgi:hypothetical protein